MRIFFLASLLNALTPVVARANTQVLFNQAGDQASVVLFGAPADPDASGFYLALNAPREDFQGKWSKKLSLQAPNGNKALDVACVFSKVIENSGTCTLIFHHAPDFLVVNRGKGSVRLLLAGAAAEQFAANFVLPDEINSIYRSKDGRLQVSFLREEGRVSWFVIDWNGKGIF